MQQQLDAMHDRERDDLIAAAQLDEAPGLDKVAPALAEIWAQEAAGPAPAQLPARQESHGWRTALSMAAAVLVAVMLWQTLPTTTTTADDPIMLGTEGFALALPAEPQDAYRELHWIHPNPAGLRFEVRVLAADLPGSPALLAQSPKLDELTWTNMPDSASWPDTITVEVTALDATGRIVDVISQTVRRVP